MSENELSAGVKILIERMKTNPEDFELQDFDPGRMMQVKGRFYDYGQALKRIITGNGKKEIIEGWNEWHMFSEAEQSALLEAYKTMCRNKFDAEILALLMDGEYVERQYEEVAKHRLVQHSIYQQALAQQTQINTTTLTTTQSNGTSGGLIGAVTNALGFK